MYGKESKIYGISFKGADIHCYFHSPWYCTLDKDHINSISVNNVSDTITTMYPLVEPAFNDIAKQIVDTQSIDNIQFSKDSQYTYSMLYNAIVDTINKGKK